jgi:DNA-binding NarL/FixJ family response regulator
MISVIVVDDHALMRAGLISLLRDMPDVDVRGQGATAADALALARAHKPDVAILDFGLPDSDGVKAAAAIRAAGIKTTVLLVTMYSEPFVLAAARREASIRGYILKRDAFEDMASAIRAVSRGDHFLSPTLAGELGLQTEPQLKGLSEREIEVLSLVASGASTAAIATRLGIAEKTVETHRKNIRAKLGMDSTADLVRFAVRTGLVQG